MTVYKNRNLLDKSNVRFTGERTIEYNKNEPNNEMIFIDYGLSILSTAVFERYQLSSTFDLAELFHKLSLDSLLFGYEVIERFYEIGSFEGLNETEEFLKKAIL